MFFNKYESSLNLLHTNECTVILNQSKNFTLKHQNAPTCFDPTSLQGIQHIHRHTICCRITDTYNNVL